MPELVLRFGEMPTSKPLRQWLGGARGAAQLVVDPPAAGTSRRGAPAAIVRADPAALAAGWRERLGDGGATAAGASAGSAAADGAGAAIDGRARRRSSGRPSPALHARARRAPTRDGDLVYTASSMPIRDQEAFLAASRAPTSRSSATAAPTGSTAWSPRASAPRAASGRPTSIVTGDLGLLHDIGGLAALRDVDAPVRIVVINNGGGGIFHFLPAGGGSSTREEFEALLGTPRGVDAERAAALSGSRTAGRDLDGAPGALRGRHRADRGPRRPARERRAHRRLDRGAVAAVRAAI